GFRPQQLMMEQVFNLHELMVAHSAMVTILMDIMAAYDYTNQQLLWSDLATNLLDPHAELTG
ncbi:hypothetical protein HDU81_001653, partial [Chytriomyces hyalinus]